MYDDATPRRAERAREILNKLERIYLSAIRAIALVAATVLVIYAVWLAASGLYKVSRDASSVKEEPAVVSPEEVTAIDLREVTNSAAQPATDPAAAEKRFYADFGKRYYDVFKAKFEPFKKPDDQVLSQKAFDERYLHTSDRLEAINEGNANFSQDSADLESLLTTMKAAAADQKTVDRLKAYRVSKKIPVTRTETGTRSERYCYYYSDYFGQCGVWDTRTVPYTRKVQDMKLPAGIVSHTDLFGAYQDAYLSKLATKRQANEAAADRERGEIAADNVTGQARLWSALTVVGGFVTLMFLFLLIALERHQRRIAASVPPLDQAGDDTWASSAPVADDTYA
jgi:hypothetical protein